MDDSLFPDRDGGTDKRATPRKSARGRGVEPAPASPTLHALRDALPTTLRLGTSSWGYPGWIGSVWAQEYTPQKLSKQEIGRASCRERVCQYVYISVVSGS